MPETVRYGLISTATIGFYAHVPAARTSPNSELVAVGSRNLDTAQEAAKEHGIPLAFGSYQEMIESDEIDAVINTLPNAMHHEWTIKAAEAGKHVICEKPFSVTMAEAREMISAAEANNVLLIEGFTPRWNKQMRTVRRLVADGEIGEVIHLQVGLSFTMDDDREGRPGDPRAEGSLMGFGCYGVYALRYAMGVEPVLAMALERKRPGVRFDTTANALLQFPNGAAGHLWCCLEGPQRGLLEVFGSNGKIVPRRGVHGSGSRDRGQGRCRARSNGDDQRGSLPGAARRVLGVHSHRQATGVPGRRRPAQHGIDTRAVQVD